MSRWWELPASPDSPPDDEYYAPGDAEAEEQADAEEDRYIAWLFGEDRP